MCGGWAIRGGVETKWMAATKAKPIPLFKDTDAVALFLKNQEWKHLRRSGEQWSQWAQFGAASKAVTTHDDLGGPLTLEVEVYSRLCSIQKRFVNSALNRKKEYLFGGNLRT